MVDHECSEKSIDELGYRDGSTYVNKDLCTTDRLKNKSGLSSMVESEISKWYIPI